MFMKIHISCHHHSCRACVSKSGMRVDTGSVVWETLTFVYWQRAPLVSYQSCLPTRAARQPLFTICSVSWRKWWQMLAS